MSEVKPDTPKLCPEPGCGLMMNTEWECIEESSFNTPIPKFRPSGNYSCPRNADAHALCAKLAAAEANNAALALQNASLLSDLDMVIHDRDALTAANAALEEKLDEADEAIIHNWEHHPEIRFKDYAERDDAFNAYSDARIRESARKKGAEHGE